MYDLDGDGDLEVAVTVARSGNYDNIWVYNHDGSKYAPGWPQLSSGCCAYGVYNANLSIGDLDRMTSPVADRHAAFTIPVAAPGSQV